MANLSFTVDTGPMASSVDTARSHLNGVTVAVTAMEAAVIAAERKSSKTICENVDEGFYMLIKSQISQKAVAAYTEMTSKQISLMQLAKALDNVKRQMEGDYNMIARRYSKLFQSLNKALETRVKELDRPAMQLADIRRNVVFSKLKDDSSLLISVAEEALPLAQTALSAKLKQKTKETMQTLSGSIYENESYSEKVESILVNDSVKETDLQYMPVIFFSSDSLLREDEQIDNTYTAHNDIWQNTAPILSEVNRLQNGFGWKTSGSGTRDVVRKEILNLCEKEGGGDERMLKEVMRLFDESVWEEAKNEL